MPIRGENVGTAYVKIIADGTGLSDSIRDELDDTDDIFDEKGRAHAKEYDDAIRKQLKRDRPKTQREVNALFEADTKRIRQITEEMAGTFFKNMEKNVRKQYGETLGNRIVEDMRRGFVRGGGYKAFGDDLQGLFDRLPEYARRAQSEISKEEDRGQAEALSRIRGRENAVRLAAQREANYWKTTLNEAYRLNARFDSERLRSVTSRQRQIETLAKAEEQAYREQNRRFEESAKRAEDAFKRIQRGEANSGADIRSSITKTIEHVRELHQELERTPSLGGDGRDSLRITFGEMETGLIRVSPRLRRFNGVLDRTSPAIGRAFGKGSRNDFVNFFGSAIEGVSSLAFRIPKLAEGVMGAVSTFQQLRQTSGIFTSLAGALGRTGSAGTGFLSSLAAMGVAIPIVVVVVGTLIAAVSALLGVIVALASTISFALIGALGAVAGAIAPVAFGFGVLAAAIAGMSDAQKAAVKDAIKPMVASFKDLGKAAADSIFGGEQFEQTIRRITRAVGSSNLRTFVKNIGDEIGNIGNRWADAIDSPGFRRFLDVMSETLPVQMKDLGNVVENVVAALGNTLIALQPLVTEFTGWLADITEDWRKFTGSEEGQKKMISFFADASESAKALGGFLKETGGLLKDLLFNAEGKKTGDSLFTDMADAIARFRDYIADGGLEQWFKDAKNFADDLGGAIKTIGEVLDALDSPGFRSFAGFMLDTFSHLASMVESLVKPIADFVDGLDRLAKGDYSGAVAGIAQAFADLPASILNLLTLGFGEQIIGWAQGIGTTIGGALAGIDWSGSGAAVVNGISTSVVSASGSLVQLGNRMVGRVVEGINASGPAIGSAFSSAFTKVRTVSSSVFSAVESRVSSAMTSARGKANEFGSYISGRWSSMMGEGRRAASELGSYLSTKASNAFSNSRSAASSLGSYIGGKFAGAWGAAARGVGAVKNAIDGIKGLMDSAANAARNLASQLSKIKPPSIGGALKSVIPGIKTGGIVDAASRLHRVKKMASGGIARFAQRYQIGESGSEAIVPLNRPLAQVDPAVRLLSAFAQGKLGGTSNNDQSRTIDASGWVITSPSKDARVVAQEALDALVANII